MPDELLKELRRIPSPLGQLPIAPPAVSPTEAIDVSLFG
jgi:hypothetical protein